VETGKRFDLIDITYGYFIVISTLFYNRLYHSFLNFYSKNKITNIPTHHLPAILLNMINIKKIEATHEIINRDSLFYGPRFADWS